MKRTINFYTDGSFSSKSENGGWAMIAIYEEEGILADEGNEVSTTNNRMELKAFLAALKAILTLDIQLYSGVIIHTDSAYIANSINQRWYSNWQKNGWKTADKQPVKNQDLWKEILVYYIRGINYLPIVVEKVKAHRGNKWNEIVDKRAVKKRGELDN